MFKLDILMIFSVLVCQIFNFLHNPLLNPSQELWEIALFIKLMFFWMTKLALFQFSKIAKLRSREPKLAEFPLHKDPHYKDFDAAKNYPLERVWCFIFLKQADFPHFLQYGWWVESEVNPTEARSHTTTESKLIIPKEYFVLAEIQFTNIAFRSLLRTGQ